MNLRLERLFKKPLPPGTRITVTVTRPGWIGRRFVFTSRRREKPRASQFCLSVGSTTVTRRC